MKNILRILMVIVPGFLLVLSAGAEQVHMKSGGTSTIKSTAAGCLPGANYKYLELNNVRTRINTGGDMWWDFETAQYEIPKGSKKMSMFSAALWIGGIDANGQLKLAAQRYRQVGVDFFPGPLSIEGKAAIDPSTCAAYDKMFYITRSEVNDFNAAWEDPASYPDYVPPQSIIDWPAKGDVSLGQSYYLAPFFDRDNDGVYDPKGSGDYPYYDISNDLCHTKTPTMEGNEQFTPPTSHQWIDNTSLVDQVIKGDATLWWVFNDKGNIHTETKGQPIGMEIRGQAFAFTTNDEVNDMTFYSYEIINRSTYRLTGTYFSQWVDTDLGYAGDDYVGCDVMRGLGYCYNGLPKDGNGQSWAYGDQPPAIGVDFFQGPYIDPDGYDNPSFKMDINKLGPSYNESCDIVAQDSTMQTLPNGFGVTSTVLVNAAAINGVNFGNGIIDDERFGMRRFVYHNNGGPDATSDPSIAIEYYNYLRGIWKDGAKMKYYGNAHPLSGGTGPVCAFMFPNETDICNWGTDGVVPNPKKWTEVTANNAPEDRRFMESAGPFTLEPGSVNYITVGIPWARATSGGPEASVRLLQSVDDKCQQLFDNCFKVIAGPNAPDLTIRELNNEFLIYLTNRKTNDAGNNYHEAYTEYDPRIQPPPGETWDQYYHFEGYQVYMLKNSNVTIADIHNSDLARLVYQSDIKNDVSRIVNYNFDQTLGASVPREEVNGKNAGIQHSFSLTIDPFTSAQIVNNKQYYFLAVAYAYNNYKTYIPTVAENLNGQKQQYLQGRNNIKVYTGIPHPTIGLIAGKVNYGDGIIVTRVAGQGNSGNFLDFTDETVNDILSKKPTDSTNLLGNDNYPIAYNATYTAGHGPINVKVIDPLNVKDGNYTVVLDSMYNIHVPVGDFDTIMPTTRWKLIDNETQIVYKSDTTIDQQNEQMFLDLGLSVQLNQTLYPGVYKTSERWDSQNNKWVPIYTPVLANNGVLGSGMEFKGGTSWLGFVADVDGTDARNWIRSGSQVPSVGDTVQADLYTHDWDAPGKPYDPNQDFEKVLDGTWAPYMLCSSRKQQDPVAGITYGEPINKLTKNCNFFSDLASIDIVFTSDKSKWTRSPIIEMSNKPELAEGNAAAFELRKHRSVNINGDTAVENSDPTLNSDYISKYGMGWFPGYAINLETGERLNIIFGEDSHLKDDNGADMLFNPSSRIRNNSTREWVFGGKHYIYVMAHTENKKARISTPTQQVSAKELDFPAYDAGLFATTLLNKPFSGLSYKLARSFMYANTMWVGIPLANPTAQWLSEDIKIKLRVTKPIRRYFSTPIPDGTVTTHNINNFWPQYSFSTSGVATVKDSTAKAVSDLDKINVVPNPYNGYSDYENLPTDNLVKITNLPQTCTITIYSTGGSLIRTFNKAEAKTYIDWDLKNFAGIPIAGGVYIIHVKVPGVGEKIVKWFGALRPVDLNNF
ncbi:MAG: hypothetical protein HXX13_10945 [Bacteroidetes bacterium]|nr:hypothetical protein [Bacteroidota bacterium]